MKINKNINILKAEKKEEKLIYGIVYEPNVPDLQGDFINEIEIEKMAHNYLMNSQEIGLQHQMDISNGVKIVESYIASQDLEINKNKIIKGTWIIACKVLDENIWNLIKENKLTGFSFSGTAE